MPYPPLYTRLSNFVRDAYNGLVSPSPSSTDAELNSIATSLNATIAAVRAVTTASGRLQNVAQAIAQALVATWTGPAPASPGPIVTDIVWDSVYSVDSVLVLVGSTPLHPTAFSIADEGGFVAITPTTYPATGATVTVWVFEAGAGIITRLASTANGEGASLIGVEDPTAVILAANVEGGLVEVATNLAALVTALGALEEYVLRDGSVPLTGDLDFGGFKGINAADGVDDGDLITVRQIASYIDAWNDLSQFYLKRDGTTAMAGVLNHGNNKSTNLADPDLNQPFDVVNVRTVQRIIAASGALPVGSAIDYFGTVPPPNWLFMDSSVYLGEDYPVLYALLPSNLKTGAAIGAQAASFTGTIIAGQLTAGVLQSIAAMTLNVGAGYLYAPLVRVVNPDGTLPTTQPSFAVSASAVVLTGASVAGGSLTITLPAPGGSGILAGASIQIVNASAADLGTPALAQIPSGYFRVPDTRGRVSMGVGTESKTPGIIDPPDVTKGDTYNATPRTLGAFGGEEKHRLTVSELARHSHTAIANPGFYVLDGGGGSFSGESQASGSAGDDTAHNTTPPFYVCSKIIKAA